MLRPDESFRISHRTIRPKLVERRTPATTPVVYDTLLHLQATAGNMAVSRALSRNSNLTPVLAIQRVLTGEFLDPTPAEGSVIPATKTDDILRSKRFEIAAKFSTSEPNESCASGVYRQFVKGAFRRSGKGQGHYLGVTGIYGSKPDDRMSETEFKEDTISGAKYGYRKGIAGRGAESYYKNDSGEYDRESGCHFFSADQPAGVEEDDEMDLKFRGILINVDSKALLAARNWSVYGKKQA